MVFAVGKRPGYRESGRVPSAPWPLLGLYVFLAAAVACVGAAAGELFFHGYGPLSNNFAAGLNRCLLRFPMATHIQDLDHCWAGTYRSQGWFVLGSAVAMLTITDALILVVPWLDRWRLARAPRFTDVREETQAAARFNWLCQRVGLTGRRCPELLIAGVTQAYTTALPGGRSLVVLPVKVALGHADPSRFDPVVLHELAHVRMRDVSLAAAVRGISWITVPVVVLASLPQFLAGRQVQVQDAQLVQAGLFVVAVAVVAAALLRSRELAADRQAALWLGSPRVLSDRLDTGGEPDGAGLGRSRRWWLLPLDRHPLPAARRAALRSPSGPRGIGLAYGFAVGAVAAMAMNVSFFLAGSLNEPAAVWLPPRVWAAAGGVLLGLGLTPALLRDAYRARRAGEPGARWDAAAGAGLGLLLGSLVPPGTATSAVNAVVVGSGFQGMGTAIILAFAGAGLAVLITGLAGLAAERFSGRPWLTACLTITVVGWVSGALFPLILVANGGLGLHSLSYTLAGNTWKPLLLLYPATIILLAAANRLAHRPPAETGSPDRQRRPASAFLYPAIMPVCAAASAVVLILWHARPGASLNIDLVEEEWRVCALAGWIVLVILMFAKGIEGLPRACLSAWSATLLAAVGTVAYGMFVGWWAFSFALFRNQAITPSVWLFYLALPTSLLVLLPARRLLPARWLKLPKQRWLLPAGAGAGAAAAAVLVFTAGIHGPAGPPASLSWCGSDAGLFTASSPVATVSPDQVLTGEEGRTVIAGVCTALPAGWVNAVPSAQAAGHVTIQPPGCVPLNDGQYLSALSHPQSSALGQYRPPSGAIIGSEVLSVSVSSYAQPVRPSSLAAADKDLALCPRYSLIDSTGPLTLTNHRFSMPGISAGTWGVISSAHYAAKGLRDGEALTHIIMEIGHDLIIINQRTTTVGVQPKPDYAVIADVVGSVESSLGELPLSPPQACYAFRADRSRLAREVAGGSNGFNSAQLNDIKVYGETIAQLATRISPSSTSAGLTQALAQVGASDRSAGTVPYGSPASIAAFNDSIQAEATAKKDCSEIGAWP